ncbi:hypothetical protein LPG05_004246, partial [Salmonella enterica subsp. enterica serovar Liverpool]|nr:hypothetical protein [Salmonella enterica subsp. enterica serovar Liverpool]
TEKYRNPLQLIAFFSFLILSKNPVFACSGASFLQFSKLKKFSPRKRRGRAGERGFRPAAVCAVTKM